MASLKDLKTRINSVKSTQKITAAMKMVAAAKLRRAQEAAEAGRPYADRMRGVIANLAVKADASSAPALLVGNGKSASHLLVVISADRGLCGGFNGSITRQTRTEVARLQGEGKTVKLLMVGRKSADALRREFGDSYIASLEGIQGTAVAFADAADLGETVRNGFENGDSDHSNDTHKPTKLIADAFAHVVVGTIRLSSAWWSETSRIAACVSVACVSSTWWSRNVWTTPITTGARFASPPGHVVARFTLRTIPGGITLSALVCTLALVLAALAALASEVST